MTTASAAEQGVPAEVTVQGAAQIVWGRTDRAGRGTLAGLLTGLLLLGLSPAAAAESGRLEGIKASESSDGASTVVIAVSRRPTFTTWKLERPARVVVDISGTRLGAVDVPFDAGTFALGAVAASVTEGEGGARTRVVITLRRPADYDVETAGNSIAVKVRPHERPPAAVAAVTPAGPSAAEQLALERERKAAEKLAADKLAGDKQAAEKLAADKRSAEQQLARLTAEKAAAEKLAAEKGAAEKRVVEQLAVEKRTGERLAGEKLAAEQQLARLTAEKLAIEKRAGAKLASERENGRLAAEKVAAERQVEKLTAEKMAAERQAERLASERWKAEASRREAERARGEAETARQAALVAARKVDTDRSSTMAAHAQAERARAEAERRNAEAEAARRDVEGLARRLADERKALEDRRLKAEQAEKQALSASARLEAERAAAEKARAQAALTSAESAAKLEAERKAMERARKEAEQARAESLARLEAERAAAEAARKQAERAAAESSKQLAVERAAAEKARRAAVEAQKQAQREREVALAEQTQAEAAQKRAEQRARKQSDDSQRSGAAREEAQAEIARAREQAAQARQASARAAAEVERLASERKQLETLRQELDARGKAVAGAESQAKKASTVAEEQRRRASEARDQEKQREAAALAATAALGERQAELEGKLAAQDEQRRKLAEAERLVAERDRQVRQAAEKVALREKAADQASERLEALAQQVGATRAAKEAARTEVKRAQADREAAVAEARQSREELDAAKSARKREDERRVKLERERKGEEERLALAGKRRAAEEERLSEAAQARRREESRAAEALASRTKLETDRTRLEAERKSLLGEIARLRQTASAVRKAAPVATLARAPQRREEPADHQIDRAPSTLAPPPLGSPSAPAAAAPAPVAPAAPAPVLVAAMPAPEAALVRPASITLRAPSQIQRIDFVDEPTQSSVIIDLDEPSSYVIQRTGTTRVSLLLSRTELPAGLERSLDATEYLGPVRLISSYRDPAQRGSVRIDVDMAEDVPSAVRAEGNRLFWSFRKSPSSRALLAPADLSPFAGSLSMPRKIAGFSNRPLAPMVPWIIAQAAAGQAPASAMRTSPGTKRRYTGRRIDLDMKGADIHNILRLLADVGGVNIVTADDVKGDVTVKMRDVPWDQALDVVLRQKQLGQVREGNLIRVAPLQVLEKELEQEIARQKQITEVLPTETRLIGVSYADAKSLTERAKDLLSARGKVSVDERTNTLIVSDVARNLALIEELVRNLDTQTSQVIIEARIVEARSTFVRQIGVQWGGTGFADTGHGNPTGLVFPHNIGVGGGATDGNTPIDGLVPGPRSGTGVASPNFAVNMPAAVGTGAGGALGLTLGSVAGAFNLNLRLSAMESTGQVRILSSPRISTLDNHEASIQQGVSIPISVVSAQGVQTVFVDANLNLTVKPHVTNDGTVMMDIKVLRNEPDFVNTGARGDPTILKKEAVTMMLVRDGDTAVIGGIYQRNSGLNFAKVPFFADIPVLGALFRARRENDDRTEFLVFITPRIANRARALGQ